MGDCITREDLRGQRPMLIWVFRCICTCDPLERCWWNCHAVGAMHKATPAFNKPPCLCICRASSFVQTRLQSAQAREPMHCTSRHSQAWLVQGRIDMNSSPRAISCMLHCHSRFRENDSWMELA